MSRASDRNSRPIGRLQRSHRIVKELLRPRQSPRDARLAASASRAWFGPMNGGAREDRTPDLLRARQALSQLSYGPDGPHLVGLAGVEPATSPLSGVRSNRLSYRPK
jgi:hypothetical protein